MLVVTAARTLALEKGGTYQIDGEPHRFLGLAGTGHYRFRVGIAEVRLPALYVQSLIEKEALTL